MDLRLALTLYQPWADLVVSGIKRIENRPWAPSPGRCSPGTWIAIHAGLHYDVEGEHRAAQILNNLGQPFRFRRPRPEANPDFMGAVVGVARFAGTVRRSEDPWFFGPVGWVLDDVVAIDLVRCSGSRGLWVLPEPYQKDVLAAARRAPEQSKT